MLLLLSIICTTAPSDEDVNREIEVDVVDLSKTTVDFEIRGEARSGKDSFSYKVCGRGSNVVFSC